MALSLPFSTFHVYCQSSGNRLHTNARRSVRPEATQSINWAPLRMRRRWRWRVMADNSSDAAARNGGDNGEAAGASPSISKSRRDLLLDYVRNAQPEMMEFFIKRAPQQVVEGMRQTVTNMLGTLPAKFFTVTVSTVAENLAQLMYSVMMTGYMFRNTQFRLELQKSLSQVALPPSRPIKPDTKYASGAQKNVSGEVIRWHNEIGPETMDAIQYIELLEAELDELKQQLARSRGTLSSQNEILEYLKSLEPQNLQELTASASEDTLEAMNTFIKRLVGISDPTQLKMALTQTTAAELGRLLYWLMVVGYNIRNIEVHYDMEKALGMPVKLAELPPGENL